MRIKLWSTTLSKTKGLYFCELKDKGTPCFLVHDSNGVHYEILLSNSNSSYLVSDEEYLVKYYNVEGGRVNYPTFEVEDSDLVKCLVSKTYLKEQNLRHFVVVTYDACFEALSTEEPIVRRLESQ